MMNSPPSRFANAKATMFAANTKFNMVLKAILDHLPQKKEIKTKI